MSNFAQKLGWPDSATFVPALSSVADTTEDIIKRVVSKELANLGGEGGSGSIEEARVRAIANEVVTAKLAEAGPGITEADVTRLATAAAQAAVRAIPAQTPGVSAEDVDRRIRAAVQALPAPTPGVTEAKVNELVTAAIRAIPAQPAGLDTAAVTSIVRTELAKATGTGVSSAEVSRLIAAEIAKIPAVPADVATETKVREAITSALDSAKTQWKTETLAEVDTKITSKLAAAPKAPTVRQVSPGVLEITTYTD